MYVLTTFKPRLFDKLVTLDFIMYLLIYICTRHRYREYACIYYKITNNLLSKKHLY